MVHLYTSEEHYKQFALYEEHTAQVDDWTPYPTAHDLHTVVDEQVRQFDMKLEHVSQNELLAIAYPD